MIFDRPDLLWLLPGAAVLGVLALIVQWRRSAGLVQAFGGPETAARLLGRRIDRFAWDRLVALVLAAAGLAWVSAGPERPPAEPLPRTPLDLLVLVDISHSMTADDVSPTRMDRARQVIDRLAGETVADRIGLALFADWPFGLVPVTADGDVLRFFTPVVAPELLPGRDQGTGLAAALGWARRWRDQRPADGARSIVLLLSDGEGHGTPRPAVLDSVQALVDDGLSVWTAGVGTQAGAALFLADRTSPLLDRDGVPVSAGYDPELLAEIADRGQGAFHDVGGDGGLNRLVDDLHVVSGLDEVPVQERSDGLIWILGAVALLLAAEAALDTGLRPRLGRQPSSTTARRRASS